MTWAGGATRRGQEDRRDAAARCPGDHRCGQRGDRRAAQPGDRHPGGSTSCAIPARLQRVGDGQPRRGRRCGTSTRASRGVHQLRWPARRPRLSARRRPARRPARSPGARCSRCCRSATARVIMTLTGRAAEEQAFLNGFSPVCDPARSAPGRFPQVSGLKVDVPLRRARRRSSTACGRHRTARRCRRPRSGRPTRSGSSPTTSCTPVATATRPSQPDRRAAAG